MDKRRDSTEQQGGVPAWLGPAKAFGIILLTVAFYLLGHEMVSHHFFSGGAQNNRSTTGPTGP